MDTDPVVPPSGLVWGHSLVCTRLFTAVLES